MRVIVVGAGLGGLTPAQGLRPEGIDVVVFERDGARGRPQGVSLHVDDRGTAALRACLPPGRACEDTMRRDSVPALEAPAPPLRSRTPAGVGAVESCV